MAAPPPEAAEPEAPPELTADSPVSAVYLSFKGLKRVSPHALVAECQALGGVRSIGDLQHALADADARLGELALFKSMRADINVQPNAAVDVTIFVEERKRECTISGNVDKKGELSCDARIMQPAVLGGALCATASATSTATQAREFLLRLNTPRFMGRQQNWSFDLAKSTTDETQGSSYSDGKTHAVMKLEDESGAHSLSLEAAFRDLYPTATGLRLASLEMQQARLRSVKTSVTYSFVRTLALGGQVLPDRPVAQVRSNFEVAGGPGDVKFVRTEVQTAAVCRLPWSCLWHFSGAGGLLLATDGRPTCLQDRFFLGGASGDSLLFKGFPHRGLGPMGMCAPRSTGKRDDRVTDALGSDLMLNAYSAISVPLRMPSGLQDNDGGGISARGFCFAGIGALAPAPGLGATRSALVGIRDNARASVGVGIATPLAGLGSLEFTYAHPFWLQPRDIRQRWQIGLRLNLSA